MKYVVSLLALIVAYAGAFVLKQPTCVRSVDTTLKMGYVPEGMTPEQYRKLKEKEKVPTGKNLGAYGPQTFKSRSMYAFQKDLEAGKAAHLMPVFNAQEKLKKGIIKKEDIPYMQRMGSWDNSDIGKNKKKWTEVDKKYNQNAKEFTFDWTGKGQRSAPKQPAPAQKKNTQQSPPKKLFGLF